MTSQVSFKMDSPLKTELMEKLREKGISAEAFFIELAKCFIEGRLNLNSNHDLEPEVEEIHMSPDVQKLADELGKAMLRRRKRKA